MFVLLFIEKAEQGRNDVEDANEPNNGICSVDKLGLNRLYPLLKENTGDMLPPKLGWINELKEPKDDPQRLPVFRPGIKELKLLNG